MSYGKIAAASLIAVGMLSSQAFAAGDPVKGKAVFARCAVCHNVEKDGGNGVGPNLFGVVGRKAASLPNFYYSPALKNSKIVWNEGNLKKWVTNPQKMVPGTRMTFAGLTSPKDADDVVTYLKTRK